MCLYCLTLRHENFYVIYCATPISPHSVNKKYTDIQQNHAQIDWQQTSPRNDYYLQSILFNHDCRTCIFSHVFSDQECSIVDDASSTKDSSSDVTPVKHTRRVATSRREKKRREKLVIFFLDKKKSVSSVGYTSPIVNFHWRDPSIAWSCVSSLYIDFQTFVLSISSKKKGVLVIAIDHLSVKKMSRRMQLIKSTCDTHSAMTLIQLEPTREKKLASRYES